MRRKGDEFKREAKRNKKEQKGKQDITKFTIRKREKGKRKTK